MSTKAIELVLAEHSDRLMALHGVTGVAIGKFKGKPCINVYIIQKNKELMNRIPSILEGYQIKVVETGKFQALG